MTKLRDEDYYTYRVIWSKDDQEFSGLCAEFPSLSWLATNKEDAIRGITKVVAQVLKDLKQNGEPVPQPLSLQDFSGKFMVRVPPLIHKNLAMEASEAGVSLNRLVSSKLASVANTSLEYPLIGREVCVLGSDSQHLGRAYLA